MNEEAVREARAPRVSVGGAGSAFCCREAKCEGEEGAEGGLRDADNEHSAGEV